MDTSDSSLFRISWSRYPPPRCFTSPRLISSSSSGLFGSYLYVYSSVYGTSVLLCVVCSSLLFSCYNLEVLLHSIFHLLHLVLFCYLLFVLWIYMLVGYWVLRSLLCFWYVLLVCRLYFRLSILIHALSMLVSQRLSLFVCVFHMRFLSHMFHLSRSLPSLLPLSKIKVYW